MKISWRRMQIASGTNFFCFSSQREKVLSNESPPGSLYRKQLVRRDLSRYVFVTECAIRIDKQQKERYNNVVIDNDVII